MGMPWVMCGIALYDWKMLSWDLSRAFGSGYGLRGGGEGMFQLAPQYYCYFGHKATMLTFKYTNLNLSQR